MNKTSDHTRRTDGCRRCRFFRWFLLWVAMLVCIIMIYIYIYIYIYTHIHIYIYIYIYTHIEREIHYIYIYIHTHTHTYTHTYIHTYIHTHTCRCVFASVSYHLTLMRFLRRLREWYSIAPSSTQNVLMQISPAPRRGHRNGMAKTSMQYCLFALITNHHVKRITAPLPLNLGWQPFVWVGRIATDRKKVGSRWEALICALICCACLIWVALLVYRLFVKYGLICFMRVSSCQGSP